MIYANTQKKYRPKNLNQFIYADDRLKRMVDSYAQGNQTRPLILYGVYGTGKSLLAELIPKAIDGVNVSVNKMRSIDLNSAKEVYKHFSRNKQFDSLFKENATFNYHIIEEVNFNPKAKDAFRTVVEDAEGVDLVIITTNEVLKIDPGLRSRSNCIEVKPLTPNKFIYRAMDIIASEGCSADRAAILAALEEVYQLQKDNRAYYKTLDRILQAA